MNAVSALAVETKDNPERIGELWEAVRRLVTLWANKYHDNTETRLYETDDLIQSGFLAVCDAVQGFNPDAGMEFSSYLHYHIQRYFAEVSGVRGTKQRPELHAASLHSPIGENDGVLQDILVDKSSLYVYDDVTEQISARQLYDVIMSEAEKLTPQDRQAFKLCLCEGLPLRDVAAIAGCSTEMIRQRKNHALRKIRHSRALSQHYRSYYHHVTLSQFKSTHTSAVEWAILRGE